MKQKKLRELKIQQLEDDIKGEQKAKTIATIVMIIGMIIGILSCIYNKNGDLGLFIVIGFFIAAFCLVCLAITDGSVRAMKKNLELAKSDYEAYEKRLDEANKLEILKYQQDQLKKLKCPICNSTNIEKISTTDRAISIAIVGLASGKIGKQYKCKNCKHMW